MKPQKQGQPPRSKLDAYQASILDLIVKNMDIRLFEFADRLEADHGGKACVGAAWTVVDNHHS